ncbi:hypothetical protein ABW20_dc0105997 [Dactylellina cionopaga]|nr:hypothetical protein ABW20_dc0105997 [Dactylellina cionopaga]
MVEGSKVICDFCGMAVNYQRRFAGTAEATVVEITEDEWPMEQKFPDESSRSFSSTSPEILENNNTMTKVTTKHRENYKISFINNPTNPELANLADEVTAFMEDVMPTQRNQFSTFGHYLYFISQNQDQTQILVKMAISRIRKLPLGERVAVLKSLLDVLAFESEDWIQPPDFRVFFTLVPNIKDFIAYGHLSYLRDIFRYYNHKDPSIRGNITMVESELLGWMTKGNATPEDLGISLRDIFLAIKEPKSFDVWFQYIIDIGRSPQDYDLDVHCCAGYPDGLRKLIEHGCDPKKKDKNGNTYLHILGRGRLEIQQILLNSGVRADELNNNGETCIHEAAKSDDDDRLRVLVKHHTAKDCINAQDSEGFTALHRALFATEYLSHIIVSSTLEILLNAGADRNIQMPEGAIKQITMRRFYEMDFQVMAEVLDDSTLSSWWSGKALTREIKLLSILTGLHCQCLFSEIFVCGKVSDLVGIHEERLVSHPQAWYTAYTSIQNAISSARQ